MARKGKEPAGLRRYRLAQKRKKSGGRKRRVVRAAPRKRRRPRVVSTVARRRRGYRRKGRKKSKPSVALLPMLPAVAVVVGEFRKYGLTEEAIKGSMYYMTGYSSADGSWAFDRMKGFATGTVVGVIAHKAANKFGLNKHIRRLTMGYLSL